MNDDVRTTTAINSSIVHSFFIPLSAASVLFLLVTSSLFAMTFANQSTALINDQQNEDAHRLLLKRFGIDDDYDRRNNQYIPPHIWDIYEEEHGFDWIRHYYPKDIIDNNSGLILSFNLSVAARNAHEEKVVKAILKLKLQRNKVRRKNDKTINIYHINFNQGSIKSKILIDSFSIESLNGLNWLDIDVTETLSTHFSDLINFYVELPNDVMIDETSTTTTTSSSLNETRARHAPLIIFSDHLVNSSARKRKKRSSNNSEQATGPNERKNQRRKGRKHHTSKTDSSLCRRTELYVDFEELGWQNWIMAPKGYEAGQCQGTCLTPIPAQLNASNHAILQSLLHSMNPDDVPPPCCVPTETSPLSILYMDIDNVIVIKEYVDMRVEACGCR